MALFKGAKKAPKYLSIRMNKLKFHEGTQMGNKYYKSHFGDWGQMAHDLRDEEMDAGYLKKPDQTNLNYINKNDAENLWRDCQNDYKNHKSKSLDRRTKPVLNFLLSFSEDFEIPHAQREAHFKVVAKIVADKFGFDKILYLSQQNDEKSAHYSFSILNYDDEAHKTIARSMTPKVMSELQDWVADELKKRHADYGHTRGVKGSQTKNVSVGQVNEKIRNAEARLSEVEERLAEAQKKLVEVVDKTGDIELADFEEMLMNLNEKNKKHPKYEKYKEKIDKATEQAQRDYQRAVAEQHKQDVIASNKKQLTRSLNRVSKLSRSMDRTMKRQDTSDNSSDN